MRVEWKKLVISILIPLLVGGFSALLSFWGINNFDTLTKPTISPPGWLFPVVWTILFIF